MHPAETIAQVLALRADGLGARRISALTGVPVRTVSDWLRGKVPPPRLNPGAACSGSCECRSALAESAYVYLLGLYLGDGNLAKHARGVFRLRIFLDAKYPAIVHACAGAIAAVVPNNRVARQLRNNNSCVEVSAYSRHWPCLFPQHGRGKKHERRIELEPWQWELIRRHPRYSFRNLSADIREIFCATCDLLGLHWTTSHDTIYVSRKADVALLDDFVRPKA